MKRGTPRHPKVAELAGLLGVPVYAAVGILELLWHFTAEFAHAGDIGRFSDDAIARALCWDGDSTMLVSSLHRAGWLDECDCHRFRVHDWPDHADQTVQRVLTKRGQWFAKCYDDPSSVLARSQHETSQPSPSPIPIPIPIPSPTSGWSTDSHDSKNPKEPETQKGQSPKELKEQLESIYEAYPRKVGKPAALRAIEKAIKERGAVFVLDATERYAAKVEEWPQSDRCFVPHPATWFNQQRFNDDPATWERNGNGGNHGLPPGQRLKLLQEEREEVSDDLRHERDMKKRTEGLRRLSEIDKQIKELAEL